MRFTTKTEYGLICLVNMASLHEPEKAVALREIVNEEQYPLAYMEKIFQRLRAAGIVRAYSGKQGGYRLARVPGEITLREIVEALEGATFAVFCDPHGRESIVCSHLCLCGMKPVWKKTKALLDDYYDSITLEMIAKHRTIPALAASGAEREALR